MCNPLSFISSFSLENNETQVPYQSRYLFIKEGCSAPRKKRDNLVPLVAKENFPRRNKMGIEKNAKKKGKRKQEKEVGREKGGEQKERKKKKQRGKDKGKEGG